MRCVCGSFGPFWLGHAYYRDVLQEVFSLLASPRRGGLLLGCGLGHVPAGALRVARVCYRELRAPRTRRCGDPSLLPSPHDGSAFLEASLLFVHFLGTLSLPPVLLPSGDGNAFLAGHICAPATHVARFRQLSCPPFCRLPNAVGLRAIRNVISGFIRGDVDPQRDAWLILQVVKKGDRLISMDNRRLRCLHEWQRQGWPSLHRTRCARHAVAFANTAAEGMGVEGMT